VSPNVHRFVCRYLDGMLDAAALRTLLVAMWPAPDAPIAAEIAMVLDLLCEPTSEATRRQRLAKLLDEHRVLGGAKG
jgi:hypothetical protein